MITAEQIIEFVRERMWMGHVYQSLLTAQLCEARGHGCLGAARYRGAAWRMKVSFSAAVLGLRVKRGDNGPKG